MSWDVKKRGAAEGYYYASIRLPGRQHPSKVYLGRGEAARDAEAELKRRRQRRVEERDALRAEREATADADALAAELFAWSAILLDAWLAVTGHYRHKGSWRGPRRG